MNPFFSIIIPVYNVAPYLRECLDSVLKQTFTDWEAICVDDGSTDGSGAILDEYAAKDKRFRVIHQANAGVSAARNLALEITKGKWVCFLDGDDLFEKSALEQISKIIIRSPNVDIVKMGLVQYINGQSVSWVGNNTGKEVVYNVECFLHSSVLGGWFCQRCYKSTLISGLRFPLLRNGEDVVFLAQCNSKAKNIVVSDRILYGYRQREGSASRLKSSLVLVRQIMKYTYKTLLVYDESNKKVDAAFIRRVCNAATEGLAFHIESLPKEEFRTAYREAYEHWNQLIRLRIVPCVQRIRMRIILVFRFYLISLCLLVLPRNLKSKGLHR